MDSSTSLTERLTRSVERGTFKRRLAPHPKLNLDKIREEAFGCHSGSCLGGHEGELCMGLPVLFVPCSNVEKDDQVGIYTIEASSSLPMPVERASCR